LLALREYASRRGFLIYKEYVDHVSGAVELRRVKRQNDRAYRELMEDASRRSFDCVLVWKYDRFARSLSILVAALQQFSTLGIDFISYTQNIDTTTAMGPLFYHVIGSFSEFEREMIVERVRAGLANARAKGKSLGRPKDRNAQLRILALRKQGLSLREIAHREERSASGVLQILRRAAVSGGRE
jgi:DNA invertase Pin-like site-specific DNA recombinase